MSESQSLSDRRHSAASTDTVIHFFTESCSLCVETCGHVTHIAAVADIVQLIVSVMSACHIYLSPRYIHKLAVSNLSSYGILDVCKTHISTTLWHMVAEWIACSTRV